MDTLERLDDALLDMTTPDGHQDEAWRIRDDDAAAWVSRKAQDAHRNLARIDAWAEREKARIDAVAERERGPYEREVEWATGHLHVWLSDLIREGRAKKTVSLPGGSFSIRAKPDALIIEDPDKAVEWLTRNAPEFVKTTLAPKKGELRKALQHEAGTVILSATGEVVDWARFEPQEESAMFKPAEDDE